jgi:hypothetical protein
LPYSTEFAARLRQRQDDLPGLADDRPHELTAWAESGPKMSCSPGSNPVKASRTQNQYVKPANNLA